MWETWKQGCALKVRVRQWSIASGTLHDKTLGGMYDAVWGCMGHIDTEQRIDPE